MLVENGNNVSSSEVHILEVQKPRDSYLDLEESIFAKIFELPLVTQSLKWEITKISKKYLVYIRAESL